MQLDYNDLEKSVEGGLGDAGHHDLVTRYADAAIPFGRGLAAVGPDKSALPSAAGFVFDGVSVMKHKAQDNSTNQAQYDANEAISTLRKGRVWVKSETVVASVNDPVYLKFSTADAAGGAVGQFRTDQQTLATVDHAALIANARWLTTTAVANELALLEINIP